MADNIFEDFLKENQISTASEKLGINLEIAQKVKESTINQTKAGYDRLDEDGLLVVQDWVEDWVRQASSRSIKKSQVNLLHMSTNRKLMIASGMSLSVLVH